jgi:hydroxymethylpyrimidine/phosphomethylpyrimidine kinase
VIARSNCGLRASSVRAQEEDMQLPVALTIAGSDNSAGAGIQADLKTMSALGVYGLTAVTCVVAEVPGKVSAIQAMSPEIVAEQVRLSFEAFPVRAVKTGMLYSREIIEAVIHALDEGARAGDGTPLVVDPVMVATSGDKLLKEDAITLYREKLLPLATVATPNMDEIRVLLDRDAPPRNVKELEEAGRELAKRFGCAFLVKGGHLRGAEAVDVLVEVDGVVSSFVAPFVEGVSTHGTGCTTSAAIAAGLARGQSLRESVQTAKRFAHAAIASFLRWDNGGGTVTDALHHFAAERTEGFQRK